MGSVAVPVEALSTTAVADATQDSSPWAETIHVLTNSGVWLAERSLAEPVLMIMMRSLLLFDGVG